MFLFNRESQLEDGWSVRREKGATIGNSAIASTDTHTTGTAANKQNSIVQQYSMVCLADNRMVIATTASCLWRAPKTEEKTVQADVRACRAEPNGATPCVVWPILH